MDFGSLPPEFNSGKMYAGAGSGSILVAAEAWDSVAVDLYSAASSCQSVIWGLAFGQWVGASASLMGAAAAPYVAWLGATATQAELAANQARGAAVAYESAFAATVPPALILENRLQLVTLIATNIFGQNTPAIATTEAEYGEMWAQDAAAMYGYAGSAAMLAETLTPFEEAPEVANAGGLVKQTAAVGQAIDSAAAGQLMSNVPQALQQLAATAPQGASTATAPKSLLQSVTSSFSSSNLSTIVGMENTHLSMANSGASILKTMGDSVKGFIPSASKAAETAVEHAARNAVSMVGGGGTAGIGGWAPQGGVGQALSVGGLKVPQAWAEANQAVVPAARALPISPVTGAVEGAHGAPLPGMPFGQLAGNGGNGVSGVLRVTPKAYVMPRPPAAG
ncbi:PPE family protein [Mycobacterium ulcerans]